MIESEQKISLSRAQSIEGASCSSPPKVTFTISSGTPPPDCDEDDQDQDSQNASPEDTEDASRYWLNVTNPILQIRRASDQGLRNARQQIRRISNSGSKILKISYLTRLLGDSTSNTTTNIPSPGGIHHRSGSTPGVHHLAPRGGSTANLRRGSVDPANLRRGSVDPMSILKDQDNNCSNNHGVGFSRKSVSFCQRDNVHVYDRVQEYENDEIDNSSNSNNATSDKSVSNGTTIIDHEPNEENDKSLVPCFVFHGKKPNYAKIFKKSTMVLESLDISEEDMCIMGNVRVNFTNLQKVAACQRRVTIIAKYTTDDWVTSQETKAMIVKAQSHPALSHFITKAMRFYIDCDDLNVGDVLKFSVHCYASTNNKPFLLDTDDNHNKYYQVNCTPKLNVWAAKAAQELKNFAPIVKYNCLHKDPGSSTLGSGSLEKQ